MSAVSPTDGPHVLLQLALAGLGATCAIAVATWIVSVAKHDVSIIDGVWSIMIAASGMVYAAASGRMPRTILVIVLVAVWAVRLAAYITWRNRGQREDRRYRAIRARYEPCFAVKSLAIVFLMQAALASVVSVPLLAALRSPRQLGWLDAAGAAIVVFGVIFETVADCQLARFKNGNANREGVLDRGLWRYTRHPNYFGEFCVWWGFGVIGVAAGAIWIIVSPLLMSLLLLKVSGVALLERDIAERRPGYRDYVASTNAFFPGAPRRQR